MALPSPAIVGHAQLTPMTVVDLWQCDQEILLEAGPAEVGAAGLQLDYQSAWAAYEFETLVEAFLRRAQ